MTINKFKQNCTPFNTTSVSAAEAISFLCSICICLHEHFSFVFHAAVVPASEFACIGSENRVRFKNWRRNIVECCILNCDGERALFYTTGQRRCKLLASEVTLCLVGSCADKHFFKNMNCNTEDLEGHLNEIIIHKIFFPRWFSIDKVCVQYIHIRNTTGHKSSAVFKTSTCKSTKQRFQELRLSSQK